MSSSVGAGLQAAAMLARGRPEGLALLDAAPVEALAGARRSFWAMALCLPAFICLHVLDWAHGGLPPHAAHGLVADLLGYVIGWIGFLLVSHRVALRLGRGENWLRFVAIWNWCSVLQYLMVVVAALPELLEMPDWVTQTAWLVATGWALWLEWYATRLGLGVAGLSALALVVMDVSIGLLLLSITGSV